MTTPPTQVFTLYKQGPPGPLAASVADAATLSLVPTSRFKTGTIVYVIALDAFFRYLPLSTATPNGTDFIAANGGGVYARIGSGGETAGALAYGGALTYTAKSTDRVIVLDSSAWTNQGALTVLLPAVPFVGERHRVYEDGWVLGRPPPLVSGNGNPLVPYSQSVQTSHPRAPGGVTAITDLGGGAAWIWSGTVWVSG